MSVETLGFFCAIGAVTFVYLLMLVVKHVDKFHKRIKKLETNTDEQP